MPIIKSTLKLEGAREYRDQLAENGRQLRVFGSELEKTDAQFQGNAKSIDALTKKNEVLDRSLATQKERVGILRTEYEKANLTYGESDKRTQSLATQLNKAEAAAYKTENAIKSNKAQLDSMGQSTVKASDLLGQLTGKLGINLPEGMGESIDSMFQFDGATATMVTGIGAAVAAVVTLEKKLISLTEEQAKAADEISTKSKKFGIDAVTLQEWDYAAQFIDTTSDQMFTAMTKLTKSMDSARDGNEEMREAFKSLGVEYEDHNGKLRDSKTVFFEMVDALGKMDNATEKDALALQTMGKSAMDLNPLFIAGSGTIKQYSDEAHDLNLILENGTVDSLSKVDDSVQKMNDRINAGKNLIAERFSPATIELNNKLGDLMQTGTELLVDSGFVDILANILNIVIATLPEVEATWKLLAPMAGTVLKPIALGLAVIADALAVIANTLALIIESVRWLVNFGKGSYSFSKYASNIGNVFTSGATATMLKNYATGTNYHTGGAAWVGEDGPEIAVLPIGTRVIPNKQSMQLLGGSIPAYANGIGSFGGDVFNVSINARDVQEFNDIVRIAKEKRVSTRKGYVGR